ncbi:pyocin activator PrtN family protein [Pseudomonas syringae]|uniref:pyocin activator PrtN family protein n=1 Tax=Pseudomonas syringae TaxID=317 RepID=UPI001BCEBB8D|nr:pyocin activator PrtN family protein [Pseudomonas syringae]QVK34040.1 pyocin activator PrtN family protein [Pseudomonas syringae]
MNTLFLLMAQYEGRAVIPLDLVCSDYMHLTVEKFKRKRLDGEIDIPVVRLGADSQKAALGIHLKDLADYIDRQREKAAKEQNQLMGRAAKNGVVAKDIRPDIPYSHP